MIEEPFYRTVLPVRTGVTSRHDSKVMSYNVT